jgi:hypothetical protein
VNVNGAPLDGRAPRDGIASGTGGVALHERSALGRDVVSGHDPEHRAVETHDERVLGLAEPHRVLGQRHEDRLEIEGGSPDDLEQLAGRRLLLERDS